MAFLSYFRPIALGLVVIFAAVEVLLYIKLYKKSLEGTKYFAVTLAAIILMGLSWIFNAGIVRAIMTVFLVPFMHAILFAVSSGLAQRNFSELKALKPLYIASVITFVVAYLFLPDSDLSDSGSPYVLFSLFDLHDGLDSLFLGICTRLFFINIVICIILIIFSTVVMVSTSRELQKRARYEYVTSGQEKLFTAVLLPEKHGKFPTVIMRSPYVDELEKISCHEELLSHLKSYEGMLSAGYAVVFQHCRGRGKSSGDCVPYITEQKDGLALRRWVRRQKFYNGEIFLVGGSYTTTVHMASSPFEEDVLGAVLEVQDHERYNCNYRNGFYKIGLHGCWFPTMYKRKTLKNNYSLESFNTLPLIDFSPAVFGERVQSFDEILRHPSKEDEFWKTHLGGADTRDSVKYANIPILFSTGFYDIYTGGIFDMWNALDEETKAKSALLVQPYDHGNDPTDEPIEFENGSTREMFGDHVVLWLDYVRGKCAPPITPGKITYHKLFSGEWLTDDFAESGKTLTYPLGEGEHTYTYDPADPAYFKGGLSTNFGGCEWQDAPGARQDILTFYTPEFTEDTFVKGKIKAKLTVRSDCEDTCFYLRLSLVKAEGDYGLRDDINQISNFSPEYLPGEDAVMEFSFDQHAFVAKAGEKIRIDVSSSAYPNYVRHTNNRGLFCDQTEIKIAKNTVVADKSKIVIPIE